MTIDANAQTEIKTNNESANVVEMRKIIGEERKRALALEEKVAQLESEKQQKFKASLPYKDDEDDSEPYVDHRKLEKKLAAFEERFDQKVNAKVEERSRAVVEQERQRAFLKANPDFQEVLSAEAIKRFSEKYPEQAEDMLELPDNFTRQKLLYNKIKDLGINRPAIAEPSIQQKIDANRKSPFYQPSGGNTPPYASQGDFSQNGQKNSYAKVMELINNRGG